MLGGMPTRGNYFLISSFLVTVCAVAQPPAITSSTPPASPAYSIPYSFPPIGLAFAETLQINVVSQASAALQGNFSAISPNGTCTLCSQLGVAPQATTTATPIAVPTVCTGTVTFSDSSGKAIGSPVPFSIGVSAQVFSAPLPFSATHFSGFRGMVVANVQQNVPASTGPCVLAISLETFDTNTGVTHAVLNGAGQTTALATFLVGAASWTAQQVR